MAKLKTIKMLPTGWSLDVWKCKNIQELSKCFHKRYGASAEHYENEIDTSCCLLIYGKDSSEIKGIARIVVILLEDDLNVLVHELFHAVHYLSKYSGVEVGYKSQEWGACMIEYLFEECTKKNFKKYKL